MSRDMVGLKRIFLLSLIALTVSFGAPAYPASKKISYLPAGQDADTVFRDFSSPIVLTTNSCACTGADEAYTECMNCVELKEECPDCCLNFTPTRGTKCSKEEDSKYNCKSESFSAVNDEKVRCDFTEDDDSCDSSCGSSPCSGKYACQCGDSCKPYEDDNIADIDKDSTTPDEYHNCYLEICQGSATSGIAYGLQRRGCPEADSQQLAPNGSCVPWGSGTGLDRKWKCTSGDLSPIFSGYAPSADTGLSKPSAYYAVTFVDTGCSHSCSSNPCGSCGSLAMGCPTIPPICTPSCSSYCNPSCTSSCYKNCTTPESCHSTCASWCHTLNSCTPSCITVYPSCSNCTPPPPYCSISQCTDGCISACKPEDVFYIYAFTPDFKNYIPACVIYADDYEQCQDRVTCCKESACSGEADETGGYDSYCDDEACAERKGDSSCDGDTYTESKCLQLAAALDACLEDPTGSSDCYQEIDDEFYFEFIARNNETYNIVWQMATSIEYLNADAYRKTKKETAKLYTMVKLTYYDDKGKIAVQYPNPIKKEQGTQQIKNLNSAFSIYGTTQISAEDAGLEPGRTYQVRLYYYRSKNRKNSMGEEVPGSKITVNKMSLTVVKLRQ